MGKRWPLSRCRYRVWPMAHGTLRQCHVMHLTTCIGALAMKTKDTRRPHWALFRNERTEGKRPRDLRASFQHCCSQSSLNGRWVTSADPRWSLNESRLYLMPPFSLSLSLFFSLSLSLSLSLSPRAGCKSLLLQRKLLLPPPKFVSGEIFPRLSF